MKISIQSNATKRLEIQRQIKRRNEMLRQALMLFDDEQRRARYFEADAADRIIRRLQAELATDIGSSPLR